MRKIDITDKISFEERPVIVIKGQEFKVNSSAETVLKIMGAMSSDNEMKALSDSMNVLFSESDIKKICSMREKGKPLSADSLMTIVRSAIELVIGGEERGES